MQHHTEVRFRITEAIDSRYSSHDDRVRPFDQSFGRRQAHLFNVLVNRRVLLDVRIRRRYIGLRLVVIVVRDEILDGIVWKELTHLAIKLGRQRLVRREDNGRSLRTLNDTCHRVGLSGAGDAKQYLSCKAVIETVRQPGDRLRLVTGRTEIGHQREVISFL